jgi:hypothetical protein
MTKLLDRAIQEVARLPETDQDRIAHLIMEELRAEAGWATSGTSREEALANLDEVTRMAVASMIEHGEPIS